MKTGAAKSNLDFWNKIIFLSFSLLFFFTPLVFTPWNYELFEFNKMVLVYLMTIIIVWAWLGKMIVSRRIIFRKTFWDRPLLIFLASQTIATITSIDQHTSLFGYYSRFHGGLLSTICYLVLYWALVSNFNPKEDLKLQPLNKIKTLVKMITVSGLLVAIYGIAEHLGIDKGIWIQDVQNRVFSTLGQPNWLAAYLNILIFLNLGSFFSHSGSWKDNLVFYLLHFVFYLCLLYTKSRSGFLGFIFPFIGLIVFVSLPAIKEKSRSQIWKMVISSLTVILLSILVGTPLNLKLKSKINFSFLSDVEPEMAEIESKPETNSQARLLITPSSDIRKIVWKGAIDLWRQYPIFGTGVETFAYAYYWVRPTEHNLTSEWDFLYNKAHNEYLNFAANTGTFGLISFLILPTSFLIWLVKRSTSLHSWHQPKQRFGAQNPVPNAIHPGVFTVWRSGIWVKTRKGLGSKTPLVARGVGVGVIFAVFSILITDFFGFSVVSVALLFFLLPAIVVVTSEEKGQKMGVKIERLENVPPRSKKTNFLLTINALATIFLLWKLTSYWLADLSFAKGEGFRELGFLDSALSQLNLAIRLNPTEPLFYSRRALILSRIVANLTESRQTSGVEEFIQSAIEDSEKALAISPYHINLYKDQAKMWYYLAFFDLSYLGESIKTLNTAITYAPTDPKIPYNIGLAYQILDNQDEAKKYLEKALTLKPDFIAAKEAFEKIK